MKRQFKKCAMFGSRHGCKNDRRHLPRRIAGERPAPDLGAMRLGRRMGQRLDRACVRMGADMKIEAGKYYRTRGGHVFGPMVMDADPEMVYPLRLGAEAGAPCWEAGAPCWTDEGAWLYVRPSPFDLVAEVYVSDTQTGAPAATPSDDTVVSLNFSQMARDGSKWAAGSIGFWIGDEMRTAHYDVRIGGVEGKAWPSDVPNPWRDKRGLPAPVLTPSFIHPYDGPRGPLRIEEEPKTLRDEFAFEAMKKLMDMSGLKAAALHDEANRIGLGKLSYGIADAMMEARK